MKILIAQKRKEVKEVLARQVLRMSLEKILTNKYIPEVVPLPIPKDFLDDPDSYIKNAQIINFDMIHVQCRGQQRKNSDKRYQTVCAKDVKKMSQKVKKGRWCLS